MKDFIMVINQHSQGDMEFQYSHEYIKCLLFDISQLTIIAESVNLSFTTTIATT